MARVESSPAYQLPQSMAQGVSAHLLAPHGARRWWTGFLVFVAGLLLPSVVGMKPPHYAIRGNGEPI
jgi:hypothetical protein